MTTSSTPPLAVKLITCDDIAGLITITFKKPYPGDLFMGFLNLTRVSVGPAGGLGIGGSLIFGDKNKASTTNLQVDAAHFATVEGFLGTPPSFTIVLDYDTATRAARAIHCSSLAAAAPAAE